MFRVLFLIPIILCIVWYLFLRQNQIPIKKGRKGFVYILAMSTLVLGFFIIMMHLTNPT